MIETLYRRGLEFAELHEELHPPDGGPPIGKERSKIVKEKNETFKWFFDQIVEIKSIFKEYLSIGKL